MTVPTEPKKLMRRCVNKVTGVGYCHYCNVLLIGLPEARKHFKVGHFISLPTTHAYYGLFRARNIL